MTKSVAVNQLANEIVKAVKEYTEDVVAGIEMTLDARAKAIMMDAAMHAPHDTGDYARSFRVTKDKRDTKSRRIIWNKKHYRRVHLLEFGHAKVNGGRVSGTPHLRPAYEKYGAQLPDDIKRIIEEGGKR